MQTLACLVNLTSQKNKCTFFLTTSIMQILNNIQFQSVALDNDDNINNHTNTNSGTIYGTMSST